MFESNGFSGLTKAQSAIIKYWQSKCRGRVMPTRQDIDPGVLRSHLSAISIVEIEADGGVRFRIAGSQVRAVFGREMRGRRLDEINDEAADMWSLGLTAVLDKRAPVGGVIQRPHDCHTWLRLPLETGGQSRLVLCHDMVIAKRLPGDDDDLKSCNKSNSIDVLAA
ncbi:MAG: PAS domain-containing protein [Alphaproteobacteria bacterium]|jgi:hypothetical protein|nr:PAS domain-containing protein [Alphaproteobacteria bacterium]